MRKLLLLGLLAMSTAAGAQSVEIARGDWRNLPVIGARSGQYMTTTLLEGVERIAREETCSVPGLSRRLVELDVPIAIKFDRAGAVERIVVHDMGCRPLESLLGGAALNAARRGAYRPTGENEALWYLTHINLRIR